MIGLRDKEIGARLERLSEKTGRSKSFYVRQALQEFLDDREDYLLGLARLNSGSRRLILAEAEKELKVWKVEIQEQALDDLRRLDTWRLSALTSRWRMGTLLPIKRGVASGTFRPVLRQYGGFATRTRELRR